MERSLPDQVTIVSTIPIIVVKCLLVLLLLQMLHAYSFFHFVLFKQLFQSFSMNLRDSLEGNNKDFIERWK